MFFWLFVALWVMMMVIITGTVTDTSDVPGLAVAGLALFWVISLGLTAAAFWMPIVRVEIADDVRVREQTPVWRRVRHFAAKDLSVSGIEQHEDGEGGVSYTCSLLLPDGQKIMLAFSTSRPSVAAERARLVAALQVAERKA